VSCTLRQAQDEGVVRLFVELRTGLGQVTMSWKDSFLFGLIRNNS